MAAITLGISVLGPASGSTFTMHDVTVSSNRRAHCHDFFPILRCFADGVAAGSCGQKSSNGQGPRYLRPTAVSRTSVSVQMRAAKNFLRAVATHLIDSTNN